MVVLAPKCVLCVAGYFGVGTALGWTGAELCGGPDRATPPVVAWPVVASVTLTRYESQVVRRLGAGAKPVQGGCTPPPPPR